MVNKLKTPFLPELQVVSEVACSGVFSVSKGKDPTASTKKKTCEHMNIRVRFSPLGVNTNALSYTDGVELLPQGELGLLVGGEHSVVS